MMLDPIFTFAQTLNLFGLLQCMFILAIIVSKAADIREAVPTLAFFSTLGLAFALPAALELRLDQWGAAATWLVQAFIPPLSYLLILQIAMERLPPPRHLVVLALPLFGLPAASAAVAISALPLFDLPFELSFQVDPSENCIGTNPCPDFATFLQLFGVVPGAVVLLLLWLHRGVLAQLRERHGTHDRYWVVLTLIVFNILNLGVDMPRAMQLIGPGEWTLIHTIFGLAFVYLVTTLVFRIGPKPVVPLPGFAPRRFYQVDGRGAGSLDIVRVVERPLTKAPRESLASLDDVHMLDAAAREAAKSFTDEQ